MTPAEFKAWFDGFTEAFSGCPTKAQWARIKERVGEIDGKRVTETVYVDRYIKPYPYWHYLGNGVCHTYTSNSVGSSSAGNLSQMQAYQSALNSVNQCSSFNSVQAMNQLGRAEAKAIAA